MSEICILQGSPRKKGNTQALAGAFESRMKEKGLSCSSLWLYDMKLLPCMGCRTCQDVFTGFGCVLKDDMEKIFDEVMNSRLIVLASPIYSWYCTPPVKMVMDRLVYGMNKYYGSKPGPSLWEGKKVALITTCGYKPETGADLWNEGVRRYCRHSKLIYTSMLVERHMGYECEFMDGDKLERVREFADMLADLI